MRRCRRSILVLSIALVTFVPAAVGQRDAQRDKLIREHEAEGGVRGFHGGAALPHGPQ